MKQIVLLLSCIALAISMGCTKSQSSIVQPKSESSYLRFSVDTATGIRQSLSGIRLSSETASVNAIQVKILSSTDNATILDKTLDVSLFSGEYLTTPVLMSPGQYKLSKFIVGTVDSSDTFKAVYATPKKDSSTLSTLVDNPLDISFTVKKDTTTTLTPEVISVDGLSAEEFGFKGFTFTVVDTLRVFVYVQKYDNKKKAYVGASGDIIFEYTNSDSKNIEVSKSTKGAITPFLLEKSNETSSKKSYTLKIKQGSKLLKTAEYSYDTLKELGNYPLTITIPK